MTRKQAIIWMVLAGIVSGVYVHSQRYLAANPSAKISPELLIRLPRLAQVFASAGDRNLAANMAAIRVLVAETQFMNEDDFRVQAQLQDDVSWLNPAHEDNYYIAANLLPWAGQVDAAERVLRRAAEARPYDFLPAFHVGFIHYHFRRNPVEGARWLLRAAEQTTDQGDQWSLQVVAAKWIERGYETAAAARIVSGMADTAPPGGFKRYLRLRAERLFALDRLRLARDRFVELRGQPPSSLSELVAAGILDGLPADPMGIGFSLDNDGNPVFADPSRGRR